MSERIDPYPPAAASTGANTPGRIALILAIVATVVAAVAQVLSVFAPLQQQNVGAAYAQIAGLFGVIGGIHLLLSIGAVVFGAVGVTRRTDSRIAAALGLGAGAVGVISGIIGFAVIPLVAGLL
jgi:hypothetical protein